MWQSKFEVISRIVLLMEPKSSCWSNGLQPLSKFVYYEQILVPIFRLIWSCAAKWQPETWSSYSISYFTCFIICRYQKDCIIYKEWEYLLSIWPLALGRMLLLANLCRKSVNEERQALTVQSENTVTNVSRLKRSKFLRLCFDLQKAEGNLPCTTEGWMEN